MLRKVKYIFYVEIHLGFGIPLIIGAKLAYPDKFCLSFIGDGAFGMSGLDIETSARAGIPITTVLLNNGGMVTYPVCSRWTSVSVTPGTCQSIKKPVNQLS